MNRTFKDISFAFNSLIAFSDISLDTENFLYLTHRSLFSGSHFIIQTTVKISGQSWPYVYVDKPGLTMQFLVLSFELTLQPCALPQGHQIWGSDHNEVPVL